MRRCRRFAATAVNICAAHSIAALASRWPMVVTSSTAQVRVARMTTRGYTQRRQEPIGGRTSAVRSSAHARANIPRTAMPRPCVVSDVRLTLLILPPADGHCRGSSARPVGDPPERPCRNFRGIDRHRGRRSRGGQDRSSPSRPPPLTDRIPVTVTGPGLADGWPLRSGVSTTWNHGPSDDLQAIPILSLTSRGSLSIFWRFR